MVSTLLRMWYSKDMNDYTIAAEIISNRDKTNIESEKNYTSIMSVVLSR